MFTTWIEPGRQMFQVFGTQALSRAIESQQHLEYTCGIVAVLRVAPEERDDGCHL